MSCSRYVCQVLFYSWFIWFYGTSCSWNHNCCRGIYCKNCSLRNQTHLPLVLSSLVTMLGGGFLLWDYWSWKPNSPWVKWMWWLSSSSQEWAVVTLAQVTSILVSCWSSVYGKAFKVIFIVNQKETTLGKVICHEMEIHLHQLHSHL